MAFTSEGATCGVATERASTFLVLGHGPLSLTQSITSPS